MKTYSTAILITISTFTLQSVSAAVLASYNLNANNSTTAFDATTELLGVDTTSITENNINSGSSGVGQSGRARFSSNISSDGTTWFEFNLTPNAVEDPSAGALDIDTVSVWLQQDRMAETSVITAQLWLNDLAGGSGFKQIQSLDYGPIAGGTADNNAGDYRQLQFSVGTAGDLLTSGAGIRIVLLDINGENGGSDQLRYDEIEVDGSLAIPEPSSIVLAAFALLSVVVLRPFRH